MKNIIIPPVFVLLSLILIIGFYLYLPQYNIIPFPFNLLGMVVLSGGFAIMGKARYLFKKHQTTLFFTESHSMVTEGIYSKTRNPMYIGMFILLLGIANIKGIFAIPCLKIK